MKLRLFSFITLVFFVSICTAQTVYAISSLGGNPFYRPPLTSVDEFKSMVMNNQDDVKKGLTKAGNGDLFDAFIAQLPDAEVVTAQYYKGHTLQWMLYKKGGEGAVRVDKGVVWESDKPFTGYEFYIDNNGDRYTFVVPLVCANIALMEVNPVPPPPATPPPVAPPPVVVSSSPPEPPAVPPPPPPPSKLRFVADLGDLFLIDPGNFIILRGGVEYMFTNNFSVLGLVGGALHTGGTEGDDAFLIDVTANYYWSRVYVGAGLGGWISSGDEDFDDQDSDLDIILDFGVRLFGEPDAFNTSLFLEIRSAVDELGDFDLYGRVGGGLRFSF